MLDLLTEAAGIDRAADAAARREESGKDGFVSIALATEARAIAEVAQNFAPYRPLTKPIDVKRATAVDGKDAAKQRSILAAWRIKESRLYVDCRSAVVKHAPGWPLGGTHRTRDGDILVSDAMSILVRRADIAGPVVKCPDGTKVQTRIDLGGENQLPRQRVWFETLEDGSRVLSREARIALKSAVAIAHRKYSREEAAEAEALDAADAHEVVSLDALMEASDDEPFDIAAEARSEESDPLPVLDFGSVETLASDLGLSTDAARAIVADAFKVKASARTKEAVERTTEMCEAWNVTAASLKVSLSRGRKQVRETYPEFSDLLAALDAYREGCTTRALLALIEYRSDASSEASARDAVEAYRTAVGGMSMDRRALVLAASHWLVARGGDGTADALARFVGALIPAATAEAKRSSALAARGSHLAACRRAMRTQPAIAPFDRFLPRQDRVWTYGLTARDERSRPNPDEYVKLTYPERQGWQGESKREAAEQLTAIRAAHAARQTRESACEQVNGQFIGGRAARTTQARSKARSDLDAIRAAQTGSPQ